MTTSSRDPETHADLDMPRSTTDGPAHDVRSLQAERILDRKDRLHEAVEHVAHLLPAQAPLEVFIHHNTLHSFQHLPFHMGLAAASRKLGACCYLSEAAYRAHYRSGRISAADLHATLAKHWQALDARAPDDIPWPAAFPSRDELRRLVQLFGLRESSAASIRWQLAERDARHRLRAELPPAVCQRLVQSVQGGQRQEAQVLDALWVACEALLKCEPEPGEPEPMGPRFPRDLLLAATHRDPNDLVHAELIPLCAAFLDRGQAHLAMPLRSRGFFHAWSHFEIAGYAVRPSWERRLGQRLRSRSSFDAEATVLALLDELDIPDRELFAFVEHVLLQLPGWAGMFHRLQGSTQTIGLLADPPTVALLDFLAVRLSLDVLAYLDVAADAGYGGPLYGLLPFLRSLPDPPSNRANIALQRTWRLFNLAQLAGLSAESLLGSGAVGVRALVDLAQGQDESTRLRVWHDAFERHYRDELLTALVANRACPQPSTSRRYQLVCCIDDRMESLRRHLEEQHPEVETFGAAGFFNLAIAFQGLDDPATFPLCPVVVQPQHQIVEEPIGPDSHRFHRRLRRRRRWQRGHEVFDRASRSLLLGPIVTALAGVLATLPLLLNVFLPKSAARLRRWVTRRFLPEVRTQLTQQRTEDARASATAEIFSGFSVEEKAHRVATLLENIGLTRNFAALVVILGHDSSSVNNPHFAAYSCGACGGRSGGPNARLFARMANRPEVRSLLRQRGIDIPDGTVFVGGVLDTCTDEIRLFNESVAAAQAPELARLQTMLSRTLGHHAHERCRRFASASPDYSPDEARAHVEERAADLSQARPELGHATNAACIVGRRSISQGIFLDRRVFLVSYDPLDDPDGHILERILLAVVPVCAGINLEYFFSTVDNERLGAGTKLPHNVVGLIGVMNGASSDLRTGLPKQMIEIHEPIRLQLVLDASPETIRDILRRQPSLAELIENEWVQAVTLTPAQGQVHVFSAEMGFVPWRASIDDLLAQPEGAHIPTEALAQPSIGSSAQSEPFPQVRFSSDWYGGKRDFVPPALVRCPTERRDRP